MLTYIPNVLYTYLQGGGCIFSERMKLARKEREMSQQEFGRHLGVSRDVISNLESNRVDPKEPFINHMCRIFSINKEWLLNGTGEMNDEQIESKRNINEALKLLGTLNPALQDYAIQQMKGLLEIQKLIKDVEKTNIKVPETSSIDQPNEITPEQLEPINEGTETYNRELEAKQTEISEDNGEDIQTFKIASRNGQSELRLSKEQRREIGRASCRERV